MPFLPITRKEMKERGIEQFDFVYVIGDAYVDHSSFGPAIISRVLEANDLVASDNCYFVATGITSADFVDGVQRRGPFVRAQSIVMRAHSGTNRYVTSDMDPNRWV